jgi:hypothetical protein
VEPFGLSCMRAGGSPVAIFVFRQVVLAALETGAQSGYCLVRWHICSVWSSLISVNFGLCCDSVCCR